MNKGAKIGVITLLFSLCLLVFISIKISDGRRYPVLGTDMLQNFKVLEDHKDALEHWVNLGLKNAVLVNIDAHDDMRHIPAEQIERLKAAYQGKKGAAAQSLEKGDTPVANDNFIHAAAKLGIFSKVYWVVPATYGIFSDSGNQLATLLKMYGFKDEDIRSFKLQNGCFIGKYDGIPLVICDIRSLPDLNEPIILSIDVDYFSNMIGSYEYKITTGLKQTFYALSAKSYAIRDTVIAYSVNGGFLDVSYRWVGDLVIDTIRIPALNSQPELPGRYAFLQKVDLLLVMKRYDDVVKCLSPYLTQEENDPLVFIYAARAHHGLGNIDKAFLFAEKACILDKKYCSGLPQLGIKILDERGIDIAERFFVRGYDLSPEMDQGQFRLAMALRKSGNLDDALKYFAIFRNYYGAFPVDFYIAETYLLKGDEKSAMVHYDLARVEVTKNPSLLAGFGDFRTIEKAAEFYERTGYWRYATNLKEIINPRIN